MYNVAKTYEPSREAVEALAHITPLIDPSTGKPYTSPRIERKPRAQLTPPNWTGDVIKNIRTDLGACWTRDGIYINLADIRGKVRAGAAVDYSLRKGKRGLYGFEASIIGPDGREPV